MCEGCGRPQAARKGNCVACGRELPEAPLPVPAALAGPFLDVDLGEGRRLSGGSGRLTYRADAAIAPAVLELDSLLFAVLAYRPLWEGLGLAAVAAVLLAVARGLWPLSVLLTLAAALVAGLGRRYALVLGLRDGSRVRWLLGTVRQGSARARRLEAVAAALASELPAHGVAVHDVMPPSSPRA